MTKREDDIIKRIEPPLWWIDMDVNKLQLLIYGENIQEYSIKINHKGISITNVHLPENTNYCFVDIIIDSETVPGSFNIEFYKSNSFCFAHSYPLLSREKNSRNRKGFDSGDAIYLIMPDRFAKEDIDTTPSNNMLEKINRKKPYGRHGGNLNGIKKHLKYICNLGFTALWLNPVLENNQPEFSYHGYAITDFYKVDPRLGSNNDFFDLCKECKKMGIKMIMDMVFNHCGNNHWWINDLPMSDWINHWDKFTRSNHRLSTLSDPYVSKYDSNVAVKGWFDTHMPDLNLENEFVLNYLIQSSIWWIEYADLGGIRMDTFPYPNKFSMAKWTQRILSEYPNFNIVGEAWINEASNLCYWQKDFPNKDGFNSYLPSLLDFPMQTAIKHAFIENESWDTGLIRLYNTLANDHLYPSPMNLVIFPDNHDEGRIFHFMGNDIDNLKMALTYCATTRGALQLYYGTEILMDGNGVEGHDKIRYDYPGGWPDDEKNLFIYKNKTKAQKQISSLIKKLLTFRKHSNALKYGNTLHFIPENGIYIYFRYYNNETIMVVLNNNKKQVKNYNTLRYSEILSKFKSAKNVLTNKQIPSLNSLNIRGKTAYIYELLK